MPGVEAVVDARRGGRLASLRIDGRELLVTAPDADDTSMGWGSFLMAPWPGRLASGRLAWEGGAVQLARNHGRHAIHGLVFGRPWDVDRSDGRSVELSTHLDGMRWPFGGRVRQAVRLSSDRLELEAEVIADRPMPAAIGWHPWFRRVLAGVATLRSPSAESDARPLDDEVRLRVEAAGVLERQAMIPTGRVLPLRGRTDLRDGPALGRRRLDDAFVAVSASPVITWPDLRVTLDLEPPLSTVVVYTPRDALCVEPQTAWPNALSLDGHRARRAGSRRLAAGESLHARWSLRWEALSDRP